MTPDEIRAAVDAGKQVYWQNTLYRVIKDQLGKYLIKCDSTSFCIGLSWMDDGIERLNGKPDEFHVVEPPAPARIASLIGARQLIREREMDVWNRVKAGVRIIWHGSNNWYIVASVISGGGPSVIRVLNEYDNSTCEIYIENILAVIEADAIYCRLRYQQGTKLAHLQDAISAAATFNVGLLVVPLSTGLYRQFVVPLPH